MRADLLITKSRFPLLTPIWKSVMQNYIMNLGEFESFQDGDNMRNKSNKVDN